jgi:hypothetical protein
MRTTTLWCSVALGGLMSSMVGTASATDHGFYAGVDAGAASYPERSPIDVSRTIFKVDSTRRTDFAWAFTAGYRFNRYLAVEAGFADLGESATKLVDASGDTTAQVEVGVRAKGLTLAVLAHFPSGNWDPYLKLGAINSIVDLRGEAKTEATGFSGFSFSDQNHAKRYLLGVGTRYGVSERWAVSFALDYYVRMRGTTNIFSPRVGFAYRF